MRSTTATARRVGVLVALLAVFTAACAPGGADPAANPPATSTTDGVGELGTGEPASPPPPPPPAPTDVSPDYPDSAQAYAEETLGAWSHDDANWLEALTAPATYDEILDLLEPVNEQWTFDRCEGAAGSSYCSFINADGDIFTLRIVNAMVGQAHAATDALIDETTYPGNALAYVKEFMAAWQYGNGARMRKLSSASIVTEVGNPAPANPTYMGVTGTTIYHVKVNWGGKFATFDVSAAKLTHANAIVAYDAELGLSG